MKHLLGHTTPETAFVVEDYPYGFVLRCKIRYWIEHRPGHGFRFVSQTTNPKSPVERWNKPKASIYWPLMVMVQLDANEKGIEEVLFLALTPYSIEEKLETFVAAHEEALRDELSQKIINAWRAAIQRAVVRRAARDTQEAK